MSWFFVGLMVGFVFFGGAWVGARIRVKELEEQIVLFELALATLVGTAKRVK